MELDTKRVTHQTKIMKILGLWLPNYLHKPNILQRIIKFHYANIEDDLKHGTDFVASVGQIKIAIRIRSATKFRDWTIRVKVKSGYQTEIHKLLKGCHADLYFYAWENWNGEIIDWILFDLNIVVQSGILQNWQSKTQTQNSDGSAFIQYNIWELQEINCIVAANIQKMEFIAMPQLN